MAAAMGVEERMGPRGVARKGLSRPRAGGMKDSCFSADLGSRQHMGGGGSPSQSQPTPLSRAVQLIEFKSKIGFFKNRMM